MKVAVIGAGPSGLVTLKYLSQAHHSLGCDQVDVRLFEYQSGIGGTFRTRAYEDAEVGRLRLQTQNMLTEMQLVSSKQLTTFSDFRCDAPQDFLKASRYVEYLEAYCKHFALNAFIQLNTRIVRVKRRACGGHTIVYTSGSGGGHDEWDCDAIAVCSGLHVEPNLPVIDGIYKVPRVIHSSEFKSRDCFASSPTVMVVGCGETGADIAHLAVTTPSVSKVLLCHRDGFHFAPKVC